MKKALVVQGTQGIILHIYCTRIIMGITIDHYKDPYWTKSIMESKACFFRGSLDSGQRGRLSPVYFIKKRISKTSPNPWLPIFAGWGGYIWLLAGSKQRVFGSPIYTLFPWPTRVATGQGAGSRVQMVGWGKIAERTWVRFLDFIDP